MGREAEGISIGRKRSAEMDVWRENRTKTATVEKTRGRVLRNSRPIEGSPSRGKTAAN